MKLCVFIHWTMARNDGPSTNTRQEPAADLSIAGYLQINRLRTFHHSLKHYKYSQHFQSTIVAIRRED
jgi:hypothetical protein